MDEIQEEAQSTEEILGELNYKERQIAESNLELFEHAHQLELELLTKTRKITKTKYKMKRYMQLLCSYLDAQGLRVKNLPIFEEPVYPEEEKIIIQEMPKQKRKGRPKKVVNE